MAWNGCNTLQLPPLPSGCKMCCEVKKDAYAHELKSRNRAHVSEVDFGELTLREKGIKRE